MIWLPPYLLIEAAPQWNWKGLLGSQSAQQESLEGEEASGEGSGKELEMAPPKDDQFVISREYQYLTFLFLVLGSEMIDMGVHAASQVVP